MTTIAGACARGRVYLGGDSAVSGGGSVVLQAAPKVWRIGPICIGIAGCTRWEIGLARFRTNATDDAVLGELERHAHALGLEEGDDGTADEALVAFSGALWTLEHDGSLYRLAGTYGACGSGADVARGALFAARGTARQKILTALAAAEALTDGTRRPFTVVSV